MFSGKFRYILILHAAVFIYTAESFFPPYYTHAADFETSSAASTNNVKNQPFNNMLRKLILLAEEVIVDTQKKTTDTPVQPQTDSSNNSTVSVTSPKLKPAETEKQPVPKSGEIKPVEQKAQSGSTTSKDAATKNNPEKSGEVTLEDIKEGASIKAEIPKALELKMPSPLETQAVKDIKNEGLVHKLLDNAMKKNQDEPTDVIKSFTIPFHSVVKAKPVTKEPEPVIKKSAEPFPSEKPSKNYRTQNLPDSVSKKSYSHDNSHLPKVTYNEEYKKILFDSAAAGNLDVLRSMIENYGDTEVTNEEGDTPLIYSTMAGNIESVYTLISMAANINAQNDNGISCLYAAAKLGRIDIVNLLVDRAAKIDLADQNDETPLMIAAKMDFSTIVSILLEHGADIDKKMKNGDTSLHMAVMGNSVASINILITKGADIEVRNFKGYTPLMLAVENNQEQAASLLINAGADITKTNAQGMNLAAIAKNTGNKSIMELIESQQIEQNLLAHKLLETRKTRVAASDEVMPGHAAIPTGTIAKRVGGIPLPFKRPENSTPVAASKAKQPPKPSFSKDEVEKMKQPEL